MTLNPYLKSPIRKPKQHKNEENIMGLTRLSSIKSQKCFIMDGILVIRCDFSRQHNS